MPVLLRHHIATKDVIMSIVWLSSTSIARSGLLNLDGISCSGMQFTCVQSAKQLSVYYKNGKEYEISLKHKPFPRSCIHYLAEFIPLTDILDNRWWPSVCGRLYKTWKRVTERFCSASLTRQSARPYVNCCRKRINTS